jgi:hypothetical protein
MPTIRHRWHLLLIVSLLTGLTTTGPSAKGRSRSGLETRIVDRLNATRVKAGVSFLAVSRELSKLARRRSSAPVARPDLPPPARDRRLPKGSSVIEVAAPRLSRLVREVLGSLKGRLLSPSRQQVGVGVVGSGGNYRATVILAKGLPSDPVGGASPHRSAPTVRKT